MAKNWNRGEVGFDGFAQEEADYLLLVGDEADVVSVVEDSSCIACIAPHPYPSGDEDVVVGSEDENEEVGVNLHQDQGEYELVERHWQHSLSMVQGGPVDH